MNSPFTPFTYGMFDMAKATQYWQKRQVREQANDSPFLHKPIIVHSTLDPTVQMSAWILFKHVSVITHAPDGVWEIGTFAYQIWQLEHVEKYPRLVREELVEKRHPEIGTAYTPDLANDIDRIWLNGTTLFFRDCRRPKKKRTLFSS